MKAFGLRNISVTVLGGALMLAAITAPAQTIAIKSVEVKSTVTASGQKIKQRVVTAQTPLTSSRSTAAAHGSLVHPHGNGSAAVNSAEAPAAEVRSTPTTLTLHFPPATIAAGVSSTVANGAVAPGVSTDYTFFGNQQVQGGAPGGGQPTHLTNFTVSPLTNVEYPGNENYTRITAPGGTTAFTTGTVVENPTNYPNTTPHRKLLATFSPLSAGSFSVYILDGNTDGIYVGNASVSLGVNGGTPVVTASHYNSGTNEFTRYDVTNAATTDVFQVYATTSTNAYPSIGGLTFSAITSTLGLAPTLNASLSVGSEFSVSEANCGSGGCTVTVTFTPLFPGRRSDALLLKDSDGTLRYETFLRGVGKGPQFRYDLGYYTGFYGFTSSAPQTLAFGPDRTLYVTSAGSGQVTVVPPAGGGNISSFPVNNLTSPSGIAVSGDKTIYIADSATNQILVYTATGAQSTLLTSQLSHPGQLAVDGAGNLYIADTGNNRILKIDNNGNETTLASGLLTPTAVTVDSAGVVYYADQGNNDEIFTIAPGTTSSTVLVNNFGRTPHSLGVDAAGVVYLTTDQGLNRFYPDGSQQSSYDTGDNAPLGFALDANGGIAFTTPGQNSFTTVDPNGGNFILDTPVGETNTGTVEIGNTGNEPLTFPSFYVDSQYWTIQPAGTTCPSGPLAPGATCTIAVSFTPPSAMDFSTLLHTQSNSLHTSASNAFNLYGSGQGDASHTDLTAAPSAVMVGNPVRLLATVTDDGGQNNPSGSVTFYDGNTALATVNLVPPSHQVEYDTSSLSVGTHTLTAQYSGDTVVDHNTSNTVTLVVSSGPPDPNNGVSISSHDFGTAAVGATGGSLNFSYQQSSENIFTTGDFVRGDPTCDGTCTVTVTFQPQYPGLRQGVITRTSTGGVTSEVFAYGVGTAPQLGFNSGTDSVYGGIQAPTAIAVSPSGVGLFGSSFNIIADQSTNQVYQTTSDGTYPLPIRNLMTPSAVAISADGTVYVADSTNNLIFTYNVLNQNQGVLATSPLSQPNGITLDRADNLFILDAGNNRILKLTPQGTETTVASGVQHLASIATDSAGNVYYGTVTGDQQQGVYEIPAGGGQPTETFYGEGPIHALAVDASGAFYFQNDNFTNIFPPPPQDQFLLGYQFPGNMGNRETGLALAQNGDVYATDSDSGQYFRSNRSTGNMYVFTTVGSSGTTTATVFNEGNAPLTLSAISVSGTTFTILSTGTCVTGTAIPPGGNCTVNVKYTPTQSGENHETLTFASNSLNASGNTNSFDLYGEATVASTTTLSYAPSSPVVGQTVTITATVTGPTSATIPPGGQVTFMEGSTVLGTANLGYQTSGNTATANFPISNLSQGTHSITATYAGDNNYTSSTSAAISITVGAAPAPTVTSVNFGNVAVGQTVQMTVTFPQNGNIYLANDHDFHLPSSTCSANGCTQPVNFTPQTPGLRVDAITERDSTGVVIAKVYLYGTGTSGQFSFLRGQSNVDTGIAAPVGITFVPAGVGYVTDAATNQVYGLYNNSPALPITGLLAPAGIAVDGNQTLYIADRGHDRIVTYDLNRGIQGVLAVSGLSDPAGIAVDGAGNIFITDNGNNRILKISNTGVQTTYLSNVPSPQGIAVDAAGDLFFADSGNGGEITEFVAGGAPHIVTNLGNVLGVAVDASGSVYYTSSSFSGVRVTSSSGSYGTSYTITGNTTGSLTGVAINFNGDLWTTQPTTSSLEQFSRQGNISNNSTTTVGTSVDHAVAVYNTGNAPLTLSNVALNGQAFSIFTGTCNTGTVLQAGVECYDTVRFSPPSATTYAATLDYTSDSLNLTGSVNEDVESGTGTAPGGPATTTTLNAAPPTSTVGGYIDFTATVSDTASVVPTGTVTFFDGTTQIGMSTLSATGAGQATAALSLNTLAAGTHSITASYAGSTSAQASNSSAVTVTITPRGTATALIISSTTAGYESPVTFTAAVTVASTNAPITTGQVLFCDAATVAVCNVTNNLAIAQLTPSGTAVVKFTPGSIRNHSYVAKFLGTTSNSASTSTAQSVVVTGTYPTTATLSATAPPAPYTLTASIAGLGTTSASPTGTVTFTDLTNYNATLGTASLGSGTAGFALAAASGSPHGTGYSPYDVATGDFNGDGKQDVVFENYNSNTVSVLLGNGDGTFQNPVSYTVGNSPERVRVADFNGDGKLDLVVSNTGSNTVSVLLGNGDGTFQTQVTYAAASPVGLGVLDLNHDGIPDIVASGYYGNVITVLLGNGDGTFRAGVTYATGNTPQTLVEGDFNGDGNIDIAVGNLNDNNIGMFLGNGDGTFQAQIVAASAGRPMGLAAGDLNGDGKLDLAVTYNGNNQVGILIGQGDGTFQQQSTYNTGNSPIPVVIADLNGDGILDIATGNTSGNNVSVLIGTGSAIYQNPVNYATGHFPYGLAAADFNGDGLPDLAVSNYSDSTGSILLSQVTETATATLSNVTLSGFSGAHSIRASYSGDSNFGTSTSPSIQLTNPAPSLTTVSATPTSGPPGTSFAFTATVGDPFSITPTGTVTFRDGTTVLGTGTLTASATPGQATATFTINTLAAGAHNVTATYSGDANVSGSTSSAVTVTVLSNAPSTTTLSITAGGQSVTTTTLGTQVKLTASVLAGSVSITRGVVIFCDATAPYCTDIHAVGTAQLTSAGTATITLQPGVGAHSYKAVFAGTTAAATSASAAASLTVTGKDSSFTFISGSGASGTYNLTATTLGAGYRGVAPSGTVSFIDTTNNNAVLATAPYTTSSVAPGFRYVSSSQRGGGPRAVVTGDFNGDGLADYVSVVLNSPAVMGTITAQLMLSNGDGTFTGAGAFFSLLGSSIQGVVAADFNNDGKLDLAFSSGGDNKVYLFLGNGDGTFTQGVPLGVTSPGALVTGDFNRDGNIDIAVTNTASQTLVMLLGNGDGSFQLASGSPASSGYLAAGDLNGDGKLDLLVQNAGTLVPLLGNGDGTFTASSAITPVSNSVGIALADLNQDGKLDIISGTTAVNGSMSVALGNGDGTFGAFAAVASSAGLGSSFPTPIDFNHDGGVDIATANYLASSFSVYIGSGNGTFGSVVTNNTLSPSSNPSGLAVGDFDGDGVSDIVGLTLAANTVDVLLARNAKASASSGSITLSSGTHQVAASFPGDTNYQSSTSSTLTLTGGSQVSSATMLSVSPTTGPVGTNFVFTATVTGASSVTPTGTVTFYLGTTLLATANLTTSGTAGVATATLSTSTLNAGTYSFTVTYNGSSNVASSTSSPLSLTVTRITTSTSVAVSASTITAGQQETLTATVSGGLTSPQLTGVVFFYDGTTQLGGTTLTPNATGGTASFNTSSLGTGSHSITATYAGNGNYAPSTSAPQTVTVNAPPTVVTSQSFGSVAVGQSASMNITYTQGTNPTISATYNLDFNVSTVNCSTSCVATVNFTPQYPGLREDAITVKDSSGNVLAKTFVYGTGTAPQFAFDTGLQNTPLMQTAPGFVAVGPDGTYYVADITDNSIKHYTATGVSTINVGTIGTPAGLAVDGSGTVYVSDQANNRVVYATASGVTGVVGGTHPQPSFLKVDGAGNLYILQPGYDNVVKIDTQGNETFIGSTVQANAVGGLAVDAAGNVFYVKSNGTNSGVIEFNVYTTPALNAPLYAIAVDAADRAYLTATDPTSYRAGIGLLPPGATALSGVLPVSTSTAIPDDVAVDPAGRIVVAEHTLGKVDVFDRSAGSTTGITAPAGSTTQAPFSVSNTGNAALAISDIRITGGQPYTVDANSGCKAGTVVAAGATCAGILDFTPPQAQTYTAAVNVFTNSLNNVNSYNTYTVTGTGTPPQTTPSTTTLTAFSGNITVGQDALFTVKVVNSTTTNNPTGAVTLYMGTTVVGSQNVQPAFGVPGTSTAGFVVSNLPAGTYTYTASYAGDTNVQASTSGPVTVTVSRFSTSTSLAVSAPTITAGQTETLTATVSGQTIPAMTGSVTFFDGSTQLGTGNITATSSGGTATLATSSLGVGTHNITATYNGDANYTGSSSGAQTVTVNNAPAVISSQNFGSAAVAGQPVTMTLSFPTSSGNLNIVIANGVDFTSTPASCSQTACSTTVTFQPRYPGLRTDAITATNSNGTVTARTFLYGNGQAPQFAFDPGLASLPFAGQVTTPQAVAVGPDGTMYVGDGSNNRIIGHSSGGQLISFVVSGLGSFGGVAVNGFNTIYISDKTNNVIYAVDPGGAQRTVATTGLSAPGALAVDGTGALFIADTGNNRIVKVDNQGTQSVAHLTSSAPLGVAVDATGNYYYSDAANGGEVVEVLAAGGSTSVTGVTPTINGLAIDAAGRFYFAGTQNGDSALFLYKFGVGGLPQYITSSATQAASAIAVDPQGRILIAEPTVGQLDVYDRSTGNISLTAQAGTSTTGNVILSNTGNTTLTDSSVQVSGTGYSIGSNSTCTAASQTLAAGNSCTLILVFTPPAAQQYNGSITVTSNSLNATGSTNPFSIYGTGTAQPMSTTALAVSSNAISAGQAVTLTATVTFAGAQPTGTVNFFDGTTMIGSATLSGMNSTTATAVLTTSSLALGGHSLTAMYAGNGTAPASTSPAQSVTVSQASTTTVVSASAASVAVGQPVTLTARVVAGASPAVSGTVTFFDGSTSLGSGAVTATGTGGTAQITVSTLAVGPHSITARYSGDTNYTASTSTAQSVTVTQITTATSLAASPASLALGQTETLTATISGGLANPAAGGTVTFFDGTNQLGTAGVTATSTGGTATLSLSTLTVGTHSITARYSGDPNYIASTSSAQIVSVTQATTTTTLAVSAASISVGQSEVLTATVQGLSSILPTGTVTFFDGTTSLGSASVSATVQGTFSTARLTVSTLAVGTHSITAVYSGDTNYTASTSAAQTVTVSQLSSSTALGVSAATISAGQPETLTATITGAASPALTGVVTFFDGTNSLGTGSVTATSTGGTASLTVTTLAGGTHSITARYGGDTNYTASVSAAQTVTVNGNSQTITFPTIPTHTFGDAPFTLNATASSGLAVSYTVTSGPATVNGSTVTLTGTGTVVIQATQAGNATYAAATPVSQSFTVLPASPTLISISPAGAVVGASATTVTLTGTNFASTDSVQVNGSNIATTFVNATTLTAVIPAASLTTAGTLQVSVFDSASQTSSKPVAFTVSASPTVTFTGPTTTQPAAQPTLNLTLTNPYPVALTTTLTLTFAPASSSLTDDPNVQFSTGGRTETFTIPANSTVTPSILLQAGTVAGKITVTAVLTNPSGVNVTPGNVTPLVITVPAVVPAISTTAVARSNKLLTVSVHAFSNTREVSKAIFHFTPAPGYTVDTPDITADVSAAFAAWFSSAASQQYGSSFTYAQDFNLDNDAASIGSVTVTLVNSIGQSTVGTAQ